MAIRYEVSAKVGTYTNKDGVEKGDYVHMGIVMDTKNGGLMMKLKSIPTGWDGFAYLNDPRPRDENPREKSLPPLDDSSNIPF